MYEIGHAIGLKSFFQNDGVETVGGRGSQSTSESSTGRPLRDRPSVQQSPRQYLLRQVHAEVCERINQSLYAQLTGHRDSPNGLASIPTRPWAYSVVRLPSRLEIAQQTGEPNQTSRPKGDGTSIQSLVRIQKTLSPPLEPLLILGGAGGGKTTTLLDLAARQLQQSKSGPDAEFSDADSGSPIPVLLDLSSWGDQKQPIPLWIAGELVAKYDIPPNVAHQWVQEGSIWPLLDGLDEVERTFQAACLQALNRWLARDFGQESSDRPRSYAPVICCRSSAYDDLSLPLLVDTVATIEALSAQQVTSVLHSLGSVHLTPYLQNNSALSEFVRAPAFLCMLVFVDRHSSSAIERLLSTQRPNTYLIQMYVCSSMNRIWRYPPSLVLRLLTWLARQMQVTSSPEFQVSALYPLTSLRHPSLLVQYRIGVSATFGLVGGLVGAIGGGFTGAICAAVVYAALGVGNVMALSAEPSLSEWRQSQRFGWHQLANVVLLYSPIALLAVVSVGVFGSGLRLGLGLMLAGVTWFGLSGWLVGDLGGQFTHTEFSEEDWIQGGAGRSIQRWWLRLILLLSGRAPWNYRQFLDECVAVNLLQKVGDRYRFIHPVIQDYFTPTQ
ncbi:MAG: NACHT domain-containing NTPase [Synechococcus sp.]